MDIDKMDVDNIDSDNVLKKAVDLVSIGPAWFSQFGSQSVSDKHYPHDLEIELYRSQVDYFPESFPAEWTEFPHDQQDMILYNYLPNDQVRGKFFAVLQDIPGASKVARETVVNYIQAVVHAMLPRLENVQQPTHASQTTTDQNQTHTPPRSASSEMSMPPLEEIRNQDGDVKTSLTSTVQPRPMHDKSYIEQRAEEHMTQSNIDLARSRLALREGVPKTVLSTTNENQHKKLDEASHIMLCIKSLQALCSRISDLGDGDFKKDVLKKKREFVTQEEEDVQKDVLKSDSVDVIVRKEKDVEKQKRGAKIPLSSLPHPLPISTKWKRARNVSEETRKQDELSRSPKKQAREHVAIEDDYECDEGVAMEDDYECDEGVAMGIDGQSPFRPRADAIVRLRL